jgi:hypothetical protein
MAKCLVSTLWPVNGIQDLLGVSKGRTFNAAFFIGTVVPSLIETIRSGARREMLKFWLIHVDNARPHKSWRAQSCIEAARAEHLLHPAHSRDLARVTFPLWIYQRKTI